VIARRMSARSEHYMPTSLLDSQLRTLEPLDADEAGITLDNAESLATLVDRLRAYAGLPVVAN
jgi:gluconokinase